MRDATRRAEDQPGAGDGPVQLLDRRSWPIWAVALVGLVLRCWPIATRGRFGSPLNADEGVYFQAAALLARGAVPYRDFFFPHPPGLLVPLAPLTHLGSPETAFTWAGLVFPAIGALNILLLGRLALRHTSRFGAVVGATVLAVFPEAVAVDRGPMIEPLLALWCLLAANAWLASDRVPTRWVPYLTGALVGLAVSCKYWGVLLLVPILATAGPDQRWRRFGAVLAGTAAAFLVVVGPVASADLPAFLDHTIGYQAGRPGDTSLATKLQLLGWPTSPSSLGEHRALLLSVSATAGTLAWLLGRRRDPVLRFGLVWLLVLTTWTLLNPTFFEQYTAHLAPAAALCAAGAAASCEQVLRSGRAAPRSVALRWAAVLVLVALAAGLLQSARWARGEALRADGSWEAFRHAARQGDLCVGPFRPPTEGFIDTSRWLVALDRILDDADDPVWRLAVDQVDPSEEVALRAAIAERCDAIVLGGPPEELGQRFDWFRSAYRPSPATPSAEVPQVWIRIR